MAYLGRQPAIGRYAKLDDFASSFNGSTTTFNLTSGGDAQVVQSEAQLIVSLGGIIQEPETDYTVSGSQISFTTAPLSGDDFFAILFGDTFNVGVPSDNTIQNRHIKSDASIAMSKLDGSSGSLSALTVDNVIVNGSKVRIGAGATGSLGGNLEVSTGSTGAIATFQGASGDELYVTNRASAIVGFTTNSADAFEVKSNTTQFVDQSNASIATFTTATSNIAGNLGVNTASPAFTGSGGGIEVTNSTAAIVRAESSAGALQLKRDGSIGSLFDLSAGLALGASNSEVMRLVGGKVGIGTSAPLADLHIRHDSGSTNQLLLTYSTTDHLGFIAGGSGCGLTVTSDNFFTINHQPAADRGGESNLTERMRITSAGDVGIGATPSYARLQITGGAGSLPSETASGETILQVQNNAGATDTARVSIISGTSGQSNLDFGDSGDENMGSVYYSNATNLMGLRTSGSGVDLVIDSAGKVGIGTTTFANGGSFEVVTGATGVIASFEGASADTLYAWNRAAGIVGFTTNSADTFEIKSNTTQFIDQSNASIATFTTATSTFAGDVAINGADLYVGNSSSLPSNSDIYMYGATDGTGHIFFNDGANAGGIEYNHATNAFTLGTNGDTAAVTINSSQKVGIGTTSPQAPLHVVQTAGTLPGSSTNGVVIQKNAATTDIAVISLIGGAAADSRVEFGDAADRDIGMIRYTHSDNAMEFWTNTGERMTITSAGLVGIGVTGPDAKLNVYQATVGGTGYQNGIRLNTPNIDSRWFEGGGTDMGIGTHSNHGFNLRTNNSAKLSITAAGNVGIGSTTANALLHLTSGTDQKLILSGSGSPNINLNSSTGDDFLVQNHAGSFRIYNLTDSRQDFAIDGAGNAVFGGTDTRFPWANDGYARMYYDASYHMGMHFEADTRDLVLYTKSGDNAGDIRFKTGTNATERMVVTADGLVGIGTTSVYANSVLEISSATNALPTTTTTSDSHVAGWRTRRTGGSHAHEWYAGMRENDKAFQLFDNTNNACRLHINTDGHPTFYGQMQIHHNVPFIKLKDNTTSGGTFQSYLVGEDSAGTIRWRFGRYDGGHDDVEITNVSGSDIKFLTNNTEKMRILSDGKVGIGTASPDEKLEVWGNAKIGDTTTAYLTLGDDLSTGSAKLEIGTGRSGNGYSYIDLVGDTTYTDYGLRIIRDNSGANAPTSINHRGTGTFTIKSTEAADIAFQTTNATRMTILAAGRVGVGISAPTAALHVFAEGTNYTDGAYLLVESTNSSMGGGAAFVGFKHAAAIGGAWKPLKIQAATSTTIMQLGSSGQLGVGESSIPHTNRSPLYHFVHDDNTGMDWITADTLAFKTGGTERLRIENDGNIKATSGTQYKGFHLVKTDGGTVAQLVGHGSDNDEGGLNLWDGGTKKVQILANGTSYLSGGNIGIGTTAPSTSLHVKNSFMRVQAGNQQSSDFTQAVGIDWSQESDSQVGKIQMVRTAWSNAPHKMEFYVRNTSSTILKTLTLENDGDGTLTGTLTESASDIRLKENINPITDALSKVKTMNGFTYTWNDVAEAECDFLDKEEVHVGLSAQDVEKVLPEVIKPAPANEKYKTIKYDRLIPLLVESIKELSAKVEYIDELEARIKALES